MATVTSLSAAAHGSSARGRSPYMVEQEIDLAAAATAKGSALAAADIIEAITVGANTMVMAAGMECTATPSGGTGTVLDLGITGGDVDAFVDGFAFDSASAGDYATLANTACPILVTTSDTIDVLIQAATTVSTAGKVRVYAVLMDVDGLGEMSADEVARDALA